jgi:hypothetical protein
VDAPALQCRGPWRRRREREGPRGPLQARRVPSAGIILGTGLGLAGQVSLEHHIAGLVEHLEGCCFLLEVEQAACKKIEEITTQLGSLHAGGSIPAHNLYNNIGRIYNRFNVTASLPAGEWNGEIVLRVKM